MLSIELEQKSMFERIGDTVKFLMEESSLFREDFKYLEIVNYLVDLFKENLPSEEFNSIPNEELKEICSFVMATELLGKIGKDFTSEQMVTFEDAIKRT